jgi:superfamily II DNA/RNA helicase
MLDMGFKEEMEKVFKACGNDQNKATSASASSDSSATVQTLLFSATMPDWVQKVAKVCNCHYCNRNYCNQYAISTVMHLCA